MRVNGKKTTLPAQAYELVFKTLKDPEYVAPGTPNAKKARGEEPQHVRADDAECYPRQSAADRAHPDRQSRERGNNG